MLKWNGSEWVSSEDIDTGIAEIDAIETKYSQDMLEYQFKLESGDLLLKEDTGSFITEAYQTTVSEPSALVKPNSLPEYSVPFEVLLPSALYVP